MRWILRISLDGIHNKNTDNDQKIYNTCFIGDALLWL
jgi:hypothetical protein